MSLFQADILRDHGLEYQLAEILSKLLLNILGYVRAIREGAQNSQDSQGWVELGLPDLIDGFLELNQAGKGKEAGGDRD